MPDNGSLRPGFAATQRSRVRRHPERAHYDRETVYAILDAAMMCHVGYVIDGLPYVTPTLFWRDGERLYPGRTALMRPIAAQELKATMLLGMAIEEVSAKIRDDGPLDLDIDHGADCWAGIVPIAQLVGMPIPDRRVSPRGSREREIGHAADGARRAGVLRSPAAGTRAWSERRA